MHRHAYAFCVNGISDLFLGLCLHKYDVPGDALVYSTAALTGSLLHLAQQLSAVCIFVVHVVD